MITANLLDVPLEAEFWDNVSESRRIRLRRRAWHRGVWITLLSLATGWLFVTGVLASDLQRLFLGFLTGLYLVGYVLVITSAPRRYEW